MPTAEMLYLAHSEESLRALFYKKWIRYLRSPTKTLSAPELAHHCALLIAVSQLLGRAPESLASL